MEKEPLSAQKIEALCLRVEGKTWGYIAKKLKVTERTILNWRHEPQFNARLVAMQELMLNEVCFNFVDSISIGIKTLQKMAINDKREFDTRVQFESAVKLVQLSLECKEKLIIFEHNRKEIELEDANNHR